MNNIESSGFFAQIFAINLKKMRFVRKTPKMLEKVKILCIHNFLGIANPKYMQYAYANKCILFNSEIIIFLVTIILKKVQSISGFIQYI
jgi:hypothetical protein